MGNGNGTFQSPVSYDSGGTNPRQVIVADLNKDAIPDLLITNQCIQSCGSEGSVGILFGRGDGTFETANTYLTGGTYQQSVAVADVNGDGRPDVLVANYSCLGRHCNGDGGVAVLLANRDGTFQKLQLYDSGAYGADSMLVADLNGDGRADVVVTDY